MICTEYTAERAAFLSRLNLPEAVSPAGIKILWYEVLTSGNIEHLIYAGEHLHTFYEIQIALRGSFSYECDGKNVDALCGEALFIPPQVYHKYLSCSDDMIKLSIGFSASGTGDSSFLNNTPCGKTKALCDIVENTDRTLKQADKKDVFTPHIIASRAFETIYSVCESLGADFKELATDYSDTRFLIAKTFIEENKHRLISCEDVARECGLSSKQLGRIFKKNSDSTVFDYITSVKIEYAKTLILGGEKSIKDITFMLGFENEGSFTSFFKRHCGISPMAFKKQHRKYLDIMSEN